MNISFNRDVSNSALPAQIEAASSSSSNIISCVAIEHLDREICLFSKIPKAIKQHTIYSFFSPREMSQLRLVNRQERAVVDEKYLADLTKTIDYLLVFMQRYRCFQTNIALQLFDLNFEGAKEIANLIEQPDIKARALITIANVEAKYNIENAKGTFNLAKEAAKLDNLKKSFIGCRIVEEEVKINIEGAKETAKLIDDPADKSYALDIILEEEVKHDIKGAKERAKLIDDPAKKSYALGIILCEEVKHDIEGAIETANLMDPENKSYGLCIILSEEVKRGIKSIKDAKEAAKSIENVSLQALNLLTIAKQEAVQDIKIAKETIDLINDVHKKSHALSALAVEEAKQNVEGAKETANLVEIPNDKFSALNKIATMQAKYDIEGAKVTYRLAKETAKLIEDTESKTIALEEIAIAQAKFDPEGAKEIADLIQDPYRALFILACIVKEEVRFNKLKAVATLNMIREKVRDSHCLDGLDLNGLVKLINKLQSIIY
jgi:hypothetical protein